METSGNMHHPNNNIWSRKQNNNTQRKREDTNNHEQHHKKNPPQVPQSTPNDAITIETGILNIQTITEIKQLNSHMRINKMDQNREIQQTWNNSKRWKQHIDKINKKYNINISEIETKKMTKKWKQEYLNVNILKTTKTEIEDRNIEKNETKYLLKGTNKWEPGKRAQYLELLTRKECNVIFSARTRMINVNGNYTIIETQTQPAEHMWQ